MLNISDAQITAELVGDKWHRKVKRYDSKMEFPTNLRTIYLYTTGTYLEGTAREAEQKWANKLTRAITNANGWLKRAVRAHDLLQVASNGAYVYDRSNYFVRRREEEQLNAIRYLINWSGKRDKLIRIGILKGYIKA